MQLSNATIYYLFIFSTQFLWRISSTGSRNPPLCFSEKSLLWLILIYSFFTETDFKVGCERSTDLPNAGPTI